MLEVTDHSAVLHCDAEGEYEGSRIGEEPELEVTRLYKVLLTGVDVTHVRAPDGEEARDIAMSITNFGDLNNNTDRNAAARIEESELGKLDEVDHE